MLMLIVKLSPKSREFPTVKEKHKPSSKKKKSEGSRAQKTNQRDISKSRRSRERKRPQSEL